MLKGKFKVTFVGETGVGKTSILQRLRYPAAPLIESREATIGCEFFAHDVCDSAGNVTRLLIWDTAGQEVFRCFTPQFMRGSRVVVVCFDVTARATFTDVSWWVEESRKSLQGQAAYVLFGNKTDREEEERQVSTEEATTLGLRLGAISYVEGSAKTGDGMHTLVTDIVSYLSATYPPSVYCEKMDQGEDGGRICDSLTSPSRYGCRCQ